VSLCTSLENKEEFDDNTKRRNMSPLQILFDYGEHSTVQDPWQSYDFIQIMSKQIPDDYCKQCLPECDSTVYKTKMIVEPFNNCDRNNLGTSQFCQFEMKK